MEGELLGVLVAADERGSGEAAGDERADGGVGAGDGEDGHAGGNGCRGDLAAGIGDAGRARVADDGDARAGLQRGGQLDRAARLVVHVVADGGRADVEVVEQLLGLARVLAGNFVDRAQHAQRAQGDVFQVADGRGDEIEAGSERALIGGGFARWLIVANQVFVDLRLLIRASSALLRGHRCASSAADTAVSR